MTSKNDWDQSQYDDIEGAAHFQIQQFPSTSIDTTDSFYVTVGNIHAHKSGLEKDSVVSDASSTSRRSRRRSYPSRSRKEKQKKRHGPKGKKVKCKDLPQHENKQKLPNFPTHLPPSHSDSASRCASRIRGSPNNITSELRTYVDQSRL